MMEKKTKIKNILVVVSFVMLVLITLLMFAFIWKGSTKEIEAVANSFTPPQNWTQIDEKVEPPRFVCLTGNCPEVLKSWQTKYEITRDDIKNFIGDVNSTEIKKDECLNNANLNTQSSVECMGSRGGYQFSVFITQRNQSDLINISLSIRRVGYIYD